LRGQTCKYLHKVENKGKGVKDTETKSDIHDKSSNKVESSRSSTTHDKERDTDNTTDEQNLEKERSVEDIEVDMDEEKSPKDDIILELRTTADTLEMEKSILKEQLEKLKRVLINMNNELKGKQ
jgi:hypothetical protein